ncbi:MAG: DNA polymerase I [Gammaproteobacteria bacterium]|nr:DNA polymerase I [Gammaproteobacteria bacterium]MCP5424640.1 DNA polymerase I [Gammaproteobacteria bacterium]MCP5460037.1 DNA polymerase I [Gammaproteobacteria bacterium]
MTNHSCLMLVDGSSYLHRAFNALPALHNREGEPTGAMFGVVNMLHKLITDYHPEHMAVIFDTPEKTFRHELYSDYKAHRPPMPEDLSRQIDPLYAIVEALGLPLLRVPGVEADDVIGTLAVQGEAQGLRVIIASGDKDLTQLVNDQVTMLDTLKNSTLDAAGVEKKFGVPPGLIVDYLALVGDTSDNVPGVPGVGPKTAARWLRDFGSLDAVVEHVGEIKGKVGDSLRAGLDQLRLSRQLCTLRCDVELDRGIEQLRQGMPDTTALRQLYRRYEFKSLLRQLPKPATGTANEPAAESDANISQEQDRNYHIVSTQAELEIWLERLRQAELFAFDTETTGLDYMQARIVGVSFAVQPGTAAYVPLAHDYPGAPDQLDREQVLAQLRPVLEDPGKAKLGQHLKFDLHILANHGIALTGIRHDTMLESYVLNSTATRHDMDSLAQKYLDLRTIHYEDVAGKGARQLSFNEVPVEQAGPYAAEDADVTLRLHHKLWPQLQQEPSLCRVYQEIEVPLIPVLARMEAQGVCIDVGRLREQNKEITQRLFELEQEAHRVAGEPFNLGSPKQLQSILFEKQGLPVKKRTPKGQASTDEEVLQELALDYPLPRLLLEHRGLSKLKSTYIDKLPQAIDSRTGRVHTSYHQAVASTGRLASSDPNLQNIPTRTAEGRRIRQAFVAPPGFRILAADYSQIELRIMAHLSGDERLLQAFAEGEDIHRATAAEVFGVPLGQVEVAQRRAAKAINFGLIYGMSAFGLARQLGIERGAAQDYVDRYFARYPGVKAYMERIRQQAAAQGFVETVFGRRLYLADIQARNQQRRQAAERTAINAPMQGTAADIIKRAMLTLDGWLSTRTPVRMIMQVHDELVFEVAEDAVEAARERIRSAMRGAAELRIPLEVDIGVGGNWDEAH